MMRIAGFLAALAILAACGADGDPVTPTMNSSVTIGTNGVSTNTNIAVRRGPWTLGLNL